MIFLPSALTPSFPLSIDVSAKCISESRISNCWVLLNDNRSRSQQRHLRLDKEVRTIDKFAEKGKAHLNLIATQDVGEGLAGSHQREGVHTHCFLQSRYALIHCQ